AANIRAPYAAICGNSTAAPRTARQPRSGSHKAPASKRWERSRGSVAFGLSRAVGPDKDPCYKLMREDRVARQPRSTNLAAGQFRVGTSADELVKRNRGGVGDVDRRLRAAGRQSRELIATLAHQPAHAAPFRAEHDRDQIAEINSPQGLRRGRIEPANPEAGSLQLVERAGEIDD